MISWQTGASKVLGGLISAWNAHISLWHPFIRRHGHVGLKRLHHIGHRDSIGYHRGRICAFLYDFADTNAFEQVPPDSLRRSHIRSVKHGATRRHNEHDEGEKCRTDCGGHRLSTLHDVLLKPKASTLLRRPAMEVCETADRIHGF